MDAALSEQPRCPPCGAYCHYRPEAAVNAWTKKQQKEIDQAARVLADGEEVLDVTTGIGKVKRLGQETRRGGGLLVTDRRIIFFTKKLGGYEMSDHVYAQLTALDYKKGAVTGNINLNASGDHYHISQIPKGDIERVAQCIRQQMGSVRTHQASGPVLPVMEQIQQLASLRDQGILSDEEFHTAKARLLSRM